MHNICIIPDKQRQNGESSEREAQGIDALVHFLPDETKVGLWQCRGGDIFKVAYFCKCCSQKQTKTKKTNTHNILHSPLNTILFVKFG